MCTNYHDKLNTAILNTAKTVNVVGLMNGIEWTKDSGTHLCRLFSKKAKQFTSVCPSVDSVY